MSRFRSAAMIVNAQSRSGQDLFEHVCAVMKGLPFTVDAHAVHDPDELDATARAVLAKHPELFIVGGGDGTISSLVDHIVGHHAVLGVLPLGTANSFARTLGIPLDLEGAVDVLATGEPRRIDLGKIDKDYFANCAAIGLSPKIAATIPHKLKRYLGRAGYLGWAALQFARFRPFTLIVGEGPDQVRMSALEVRIANGPYHGGTLLVDEASVDSGRIVVQAVLGPGKGRLLRNWAAAVTGSQKRFEDVLNLDGTAIRIATVPPLPVSIDGEVVARTPFTASIARGVIEVMVPKP